MNVCSRPSNHHPENNIIMVHFILTQIIFGGISNLLFQSINFSEHHAIFHTNNFTFYNRMTVEQELITVDAVVAAEYQEWKESFRVIGNYLRLLEWINILSSVSVRHIFHFKLQNCKRWQISDNSFLHYIVLNYYCLSS